MKKFILFLAFAFLFLSDHAQLNHGRFMVGGSFGYNSLFDRNIDTVNKLTQQRSYNYSNISARLGYFVADNFVVGIVFNSATNYSEFKIDHHDGRFSIDRRDGKSNAAGIFCRRFMKVGKSRFAFIAQVNATIGAGNSRQRFIENDGISEKKREYHGKSDTYSFLLQPGLTYFITDRIAVETLFGNIGYIFNHEKIYDTKETIVGESRTKNFAPRFGLDLTYISFGLNFYFGKGKNTAVPAGEEGKK